jgi:hypothetical protein
MTIYKAVKTMFLKDGRIIIYNEGGYQIRTLESSSGCIVRDPNHSITSFMGWKRRAMEDLNLSPEDIILQTKGDIAFKS